MSFRNWKFVVFLVLFVGVFTVPSALRHECFDAVFTGLALLSVPLLSIGANALAESAGLRNLSVLHENGFMWRQRNLEVFVPWSDVVSVTERKLVQWEITVRDAHPKPVVVTSTSGGEETARFVMSRMTR